MTLIKRNFPTLWDNMSDFFDDDWMKLRFKGEDWIPAVNVVNNDKNYEIEVAAPGFPKKDIHVAVENGVLTITGETEKEKEEKDKNYTRKEFSKKSFTKSFTLPEDVISDGVDATFKDGILMLTLNKTEKAISSKKEIAIH